MLTRLANLAIKAPKRILLITGLLLVVGVFFGAPVASHLKSGGFTVDDAESSTAANVLEQKFDGGAPNLIVQVNAPDGLKSAAATDAGEQVLAYFHTLERTSDHPDRYLGKQTSWMDPQAGPALVSKDGQAGLILTHIFGDDTESTDRAGDIVEHIKAMTFPSATVTVGGSAVAYHQVNKSTTTDLTKAEMISVPLTAVALILIFGSLVASLLPLAVGISAIIGTMAILRGLAAVTDVSIYALNMTTALGLALAIDYSLFLVSRYREEVNKGTESHEAVRTTLRTAGRTVLFSSLTVALALAALAVFPMYFLRSFAYAGLAVVALAALASLIVLPAILVLVGPQRINALDARAFFRRIFRRPERTPAAEHQGFWYRLASLVMKRPVVLGGVVVAILLLLGSPFLRAAYGYPDDRVLPDSQSARILGDDLRADYALNASSALSGVAEQTLSDADIDESAIAISSIKGVDAVATSTGTYADGARTGDAPPIYSADDATRFDVSSNVDPFSSAGKDLVNQLRSSTLPAHVMWTGWAAFNVDAMEGLGNTLPLALGLIALSTLIVLWLFTGSIVIPIKALVLNMLSLSATFGAMVWVFQEGHLSGLLGFTPSGYLVANMVVLMFCMAFGMSMDYEVFLLSRIREEWVHSDQTHDANTEAVALGLARTGRIVTAAAFLMAIVFAAMVTSTVQFMQLFGLGLTLAVLADATLVRGVLVPSFMRLMGRANWWSPKPLRWLHDRIGLKEA